MRHAPRTSRPRHLAGAPRAAWTPSELPADFDVAAALDAETDFDFEALFAADDAADAPATRARVARHRIAFAVSVTLAALPLLVLDNLGARAEAPEARVSAEAPAEPDEDLELPERVATTEAPPVVVDVTVAKATPFVAEPSPSSTEAPAPTTTAKPAPTTTAKPTTTTTARPTTTTTAAPPTTVAALAQPKGPDPSSVATWDQLAQCESGGRWDAVSQPRNGRVYYGGLQFSLPTWEGFGGTGMPNEASKDQQIAVGRRVQAKQGWGAWPSCAKRFGWI